MEFSASSSHPHNMHGAHTAAPIFNNVFGLSHHMKKSDDPVNLAIYNSLPVDKIEARLYRRAHAALADPAIQQLPKEAQVPYIAWALRDVERIEPIKNEFTEIGQRANIQQIPTGTISDFLARRTLGYGYRGNDGISSLISIGLHEGRASQQLNMLAFRLNHLQFYIENPTEIGIGELNGDLSDNPKLVHVELQVPDRVSPQIAKINSGSARTKLWWDASLADQNILRLRPQGPMPTLDNEIFEMSPEEEAEHDAQQAAAKKVAADEQAAEEAARLKERAGFKPNYRFAASHSGSSNSTRPSTGTSNRFHRANPGNQAYDRVAREAQTSFNPNYRFAASHSGSSNSTRPSAGTSNRFRRANPGDQAYDQAAREAQISFIPNNRFTPSQPEASNPTRPSIGTSNRFRRANPGDQAYDQAAREAQIIREREAKAEQSIPGARYQRNQSENLAERKEKNAGELRSELDRAKVKLRNLEEQVPPDVLQQIFNALELNEQKALKEAQQVRSNANQRLNGAQERLVEINQNSKLYELAQIKKGTAQAEYRIASARENQVQTRVALAKIRRRTNAVKREISSQSTEPFVNQVQRFAEDTAHL
jgi:hypothetical protein